MTNEEGKIDLNKIGILILAAIVAVIAGVVAFLITRDGITAWDVVLVVGIILVAIFAALMFVSRWTMKKQGEQENLIEKSKMLVDIYVIDKKRAKPAEANLPKAVTDAMPRMYKLMKMNLVKAKVGKQIITLICERKIYDILHAKKNFKVEVAGLYIVSVKGIKTADEKKRELQEQKRKEKADKAARKVMEKNFKK